MNKPSSNTNTSNDELNSSSSSSTYPDAMNQSIYQMMMSEQSPNKLSQKIFNLYSPEKAKHAPITFQQTQPSSTTNSSSITKNIGVNNSNPTIPPPNLAHFQYLPYPLPWRATAGPDELPPDFGWLTDSCAGKVGIGIFGGSVCGLLMGVFLGAMSDMTPPVTIHNGKEIPQAPIREQFRTTMRATAEKSLYWSRNFAFITGVFSGSDCLVEKYRGTHDVYNSVISGCVTGAAMQAKQGPQAAAIGCGGFAAFSLVIDKVMGTH